MAKVLGESGRYLSQEATKHLHSMWKWVIGCVALVGTIFGFILRGNFGWLHFSAWANAGLTLTLLLVLVGVATWTFRRLDELDVKRGRLQSGARGEKHVGAILSRLPEAFCVINDLATGHGNLDHVVVGPTGVFVIETKNWRGEISEDGKGELIQNGRPSTARHVATFVRRMMELREKVATLAPEVDVFFHPVMVFASARVNARFGSTGKVRCMQDGQLFDYILDEKGRKRLSAGEIDLLASAFASLARMEKGFHGQETGPDVERKSGESLERGVSAAV